MTEVKFRPIEMYKVPSKYAFHRRKLFYSNTKSATESIEGWFRRIEESMSGCDFEALSNFMLIDKFISGLSDESFEQFAVQSTLTTQLCVEIFMAMAFDLPSTNGLVEVKTEPMFSLNEFQEVELIKNEEKEEENNQFLEANVWKQSNVSDQEFDTFLDNVNQKTEMKQRQIKTTNKTASKTEGYEIIESDQVICLDCGKTYRNKRSCIVHRRLHTGKNIHRCNICMKLCTKAKDLKKHMKVHEHDGKTFECYLCSRQFQRLHRLQRHLTISHVAATKDEFQCTQCERSFFTHNGLSEHKRMHQDASTTNSYKCNDCDKVFERRSIMLLHAIKHSEVKPFVCEICGDSFKVKDGLTRHMRRHTDERPYKCNICGKKWKTNQELQSHLVIHTGERPFKCNLCDRTFACRSNLRVHLKVHRNERAHACSMCDKRFVTLHNLNVHMLIHTGQRPFQCNMCEKAFTQAASLRSHTSKWH